MDPLALGLNSPGSEQKVETVAVTVQPGALGKISQTSFEIISQIGSAFLNTLVPEMHVHIFSFIPKASDFVNFASACKQLYQIGQIAQSCNVLDFVPPYIRLDSTISKLPLWKQIALAKKIEKKLCSDDDLSKDIVFQKKMKAGINHEPTHHAKIGDYLAIAFGYEADPAQIGEIEVHNLRTNDCTSFQAHLSKIFACVGALGTEPLLVSFAADGFKVWNLNALMGCKELLKPTIHNPSDAFSYNFMGSEILQKVPIVCVHGSKLAVGYLDCVSIWDCANLLAPPLRIPFDKVQQIEFSDTHLMLVKLKGYAIWDLASLTSDSAPISTFTIDEKYKSMGHPYDLADRRSQIRLAKIHKDKVVVAYVEKHWGEKGIVFGEIRNMFPDKHVRQLSHRSLDVREPREIDSVAWIGHHLFAACSSMIRWDIRDSEGNGLCLNEGFYDYVRKVYSLGTSALFCHYTKGISIHPDDQSAHWKVKAFLKGISDKPYRSHNFDLIGKYLIVEARVRSREWSFEPPPPDDSERIITVYNLDRDEPLKE